MSINNKIIQEDIDSIIKSKIDWIKFNNKTVLITGANGFLPAYMVEVLLYLNEFFDRFNVKVLALVRNKQKANVRFLHHLSNKNLEFIEQDVADNISISQDIHFIIHAASQASPKYFGIDPIGTIKANVYGTDNLLKIAVEKKVESFLYFSSGEVYGEVGIDIGPVSEIDYGYLNPTLVRSCYAESKRMGENICISYYHQFKVPVKIVRPFHTYGPKMTLDDGRVYADFVSDILNKRNIVMKSDGKAVRTFCYLTDATEGFFKILLKGSSGEAYNIANPNEEYSIINLAKKLSNLYKDYGVGLVEVETKNSNNYLKSTISKNSVNISKANALDWNPIIDIETGFTRTVESYRY
jgi:UDP-glucuronate decarboxylase